jgi:hypothetical protein
MIRSCRVSSCLLFGIHELRRAAPRSEEEEEEERVSYPVMLSWERSRVAGLVANRLRTVTVHRQILGGEQPPACQDAALLIKSRCGLAQSSINLTAAEYRSY